MWEQIRISYLISAGPGLVLVLFCMAEYEWNFPEYIVIAAATVLWLITLVIQLHHWIGT